MNHPPAEVLMRYLVANNIGSTHTSGDAWPCYISTLPDGAAIANNAIGIFDTQGIQLGRLLQTGEVIERHGIQVLVRSESYKTAWAKSVALTDHLDAIIHGEVSIDGDTYTIHNASRTSSIIPLHMEDGGSMRYLLSSNYLLTIAFQSA